MEVNDFQILLIDVTFYLYHVENLTASRFEKPKNSLSAHPIVDDRSSNEIMRHCLINDLYFISL